MPERAAVVLASICVSGALNDSAAVVAPRQGKIACEVIDFNRFGNVHLNVRPARLEAASHDREGVLRIEAISGSTAATRGRTYADFEPGEYGLLFDPRGWLTIVRGIPGSAIEGLQLTLAAPVWLISTTES